MNSIGTQEQHNSFLWIQQFIDGFYNRQQGFMGNSSLANHGEYQMYL